MQEGRLFTQRISICLTHSVRDGSASQQPSCNHSNGPIHRYALLRDAIVRDEITHLNSARGRLCEAFHTPRDSDERLSVAKSEQMHLLVRRRSSISTVGF